MSRRNVHVAALSVILLASCGSQEPATAQKQAAGAQANSLEGARPTTDPGQPAARGIDDPAPPPDAVSHPDGYLPDASDAPPSEPEPTAAVSQPRSAEPPPATEDDYIRGNGQAGRRSEP